jgi:hypothetical protein
VILATHGGGYGDHAAAVLVLPPVRNVGSSSRTETAAAQSGGCDVNALNKIGGALLLAGLAVAVIIGFQTPTGRRFWDGVWQAGSTVVGFVGDQAARLGGTAVAGNLWAAIGIAAIAFVIAITLAPGLRAGRGFVVMAILFTALAFVLYQPSILDGIGG